MSKSILFVSGGRRHGNTIYAVEAAAHEAATLGAEVTVIECGKLSGIGVGCISCGGCQRNGDFRCVLEDDTTDAVASLAQYDLIVLATPIYFFSYSTLLKGFIDRMFSQVRYDEGGALVSPLIGKRFALLATSGGGEDDSGISAVRSSFRQMVDYFSGQVEGECLLANCAFEAADLRNSPEKLEPAREFGRKLGGDPQ